METEAESVAKESGTMGAGLAHEFRLLTVHAPPGPANNYQYAPPAHYHSGTFYACGDSGGGFDYTQVGRGPGAGSEPDYTGNPPFHRWREDAPTQRGGPNSMVVRGQSDFAAVLTALQQYWEDGRLHHEMEDFFGMYCPEFTDGGGADGAHSHREHALFERFCSMFETRLEGFLEARRVSCDEFYAECKEVQRKSPLVLGTGGFGPGGSFLKTLMSVLDFGVFKTTMLDYKRAEEHGLFASVSDSNPMLQ